MLELPRISGSHYESVLKWDADYFHYPDCVYHAYLELLVDVFTSVLKEDFPGLYDSVFDLGQPSIQRLLEAPDTYNLLMRYIRGADDGLERYLSDSVAAEARHEGGRNADGPVWFCDGSRLIDADTIPKFDSAGWRIGGAYEAPRIFSSIPLDHHSIYARRRMPVAEFRSVQYGAAVPFEKQQEIDSYNKIDLASQIITECMPQVANFISKYVKTIVLRRAAGAEEVFQSASRNAFIGQIVLLNPHFEHVDREYIAESIVHESIHSVLWRAEILDHFIKDPTLPMETVRSSWSGETVYYYTLLQACLVWYGIFWFWRCMGERSSDFSKERMASLERRARAGFQSPQYERALAVHRDNLQEGVWDLFLALQREVQIAR